MKMYLRVFFVLVCLGAIFPLRAFACACCSPPGEYIISTSKPSAYEFDILKELKFDKAANLFVTEAGFDTIKGLDSIAASYESNAGTGEAEFFTLSGAFSARTWKLSFKTEDGKTGVLTLPVPLQMLRFKADIHDGKTSGGGGPLLYKEWRFKGNVQSGSGFFQAGIAKPTTFFLVFQGRGNGCDNAEDFTNWRLEIDGKKASYAFYGKLASGNIASMKSMAEKNGN